MAIQPFSRRKDLVQLPGRHPILQPNCHNDVVAQRETGLMGQVKPRPSATNIRFSFGLIQMIFNRKFIENYLAFKACNYVSFSLLLLVAW